MPDFLKTVIGKAILAVAAVLAIFFLIQYFAWDKAAQPKQDARSANAVAETAKESAETAINRMGRDAEIDDLVDETALLIENATTPEEAATAARAAICSLPEYDGDAQCKK